MSSRPASISSRKSRRPNGGASALPVPPLPPPSVRARRDSTATRQTSRTRARSTHGRRKSHELLARGIVMWDWDGIIPNRKTRGPSVRGGDVLDICNVIDSSWYQVHHQETCKYIPRTFLNVLGVYDKKHQSSFRINNQDAGIVDAKIPYIPPEPPKPSFFAALCCGVKPPPNPYNQGPRPPIPPPPFPKEPYVATNNGSQIKVAIDCKKSHPQEMTLGFKINLSSAKGLRFTGLTFDAMLPPGYTVAGVDPENYNGTGTEIHEKYTQGDDRRKSLAGSIKAKSTRKRTVLSHDVEFTRYTKSTIRGGGIDTSHANWVAAEDIGSKSGLPDAFEFNIVLRGNSLPPTVKYTFSLETESSTGNSEASEKAPGTKPWKVDWVEESLP